MNIQDAIQLEKISPVISRKRIERWLILPLLIGVLMLFNIVPAPIHTGAGIFLLSLSLLLLSLLLDLYFAFTILSADRSFLSQYFVASQNPWKSFLQHAVSKKVINRTGISSKEIKIIADVQVAETFFNAQPQNLGEFLGTIFDNCNEIKTFFETWGVTKNELVFSGLWAEREYIEIVESSIPLESIHSHRNLGANLAFGQAFILDRFKLDFSRLGITFETESHDTEIQNIISILNKSREANAVLVCDDKLSLFSILYTLGVRTERELSIFDSAAFISAYGSKQAFESNFSRLLNEASHAGNLILVIPDLPEFIDNAHKLGSDAMMLLDPYVASANLQVIATATLGSYGRHFEHDPALLSRFEKILVTAESGESILRFAEMRSVAMEKSEKVFFTAGAILAIRDSVMRFSPDLLIDATDDLLEETIAKVRSSKTRTIYKSDVLVEVEARTGVPVSGASAKEKDILTHLETLLGARVIGQGEAISAVSDALRRARAGISNENRPMGSFLFLGPTGVGKTETTKALANIFFGTSVPLVRFDMSEYNSSNALDRLIGTLDSEGTLSSALREHEYGLLLLDEFEKTDKTVMDLFLQVLDEGFFSDGQGKRVNVRNHIIIATSNAASDMIFNLVKEGKDLQKEKDTIINTLIDRSLFKPEFLNRFDGIILFHPLTETSLRLIAKILLSSLDKRLKAKGISLDINDALIDFLISKGQDPKFGARPLNRAIQDNIESLVAKRMLEGTLSSGDRVTLTAEDLL